MNQNESPIVKIESFFHSSFRKNGKILTSSIFLKLFLLLLIILFTQSIQMKPVLNMGFSRDGWFILIDARASYQQPPQERIYKCWYIHKAHNAQRCIFSEALDFFFGDNYHAYINTGIALKILASLAIFPAILVIFKNSTFAFLSSIFFAISHSSNGPLLEWIDAEDYLAVFFFCLFSIFYHQVVNNFGFKKLILAAIGFFLMFVSSIIRVYPIFFIVIIIELLRLVNRQTSKFQSITRMVFFFGPSLFLFFSVPFEPHNFYLDFIKPFFNGNLYLILIPVAGLGYMFMGLHELKLLGSLTSQQQLTDPASFIHFLILPTLLFFLISLALTSLIFKKFWKFALGLSIINFLADLLIWKLQINHLYIKQSLSLKPDLVILIENLQASLIGIYVILFSTFCLVTYYLLKKTNRYLLFIPISITFTLIFIFGTFFITTQHFRYNTGVHRYLIMASIGWSLFISSLVFLINRKYSSKLTIILTTIITICIFIISTNENNRVFQGFTAEGNNINQENLMQTQLLSKIPRFKLTKNVLIFISPSENPNDQKWNNAIDLPHLLLWLHIRKSYLTENLLSGCLGGITNLEELRKATILKNGKKSFQYKGLCFTDEKEDNNPKVFFPMENFFAFKIINSSLIDTTSETIKQINKAY